MTLKSTHSKKPPEIYSELRLLKLSEDYCYIDESYNNYPYEIKLLLSEIMAFNDKFGEQNLLAF